MAVLGIKYFTLAASHGVKERRHATLMAHPERDGQTEENHERDQVQPHQRILKGRERMDQDQAVA